ncbi:ABC transporter permease subunit [Roseovarius sp.]|uniref:ABC transporter permease n=1 Tax=Roseovarius sp. TaxID=1486281 RepID=UPI0026373EE6|nr:ABC transporter permease subunit [Roseovarius sp.]MDM8168550.1 hypothetical protein [Roseovarius sp.]
MKRLFRETPLHHPHPDAIRPSARFAVAIPLAITLAVLLVTALAPLIAPFGQTDIVGQPFQPPDNTHLLGTDAYGRDFMTRIIYGLRNSVGLALAVAVLSLCIGVAASALATALGAWPSAILFLLAQTLSTFPAFYWAFFIIAVFPPSGPALVTALTLALAPRVFRLCSTETMQATQRYALAASASRLPMLRLVTALLRNDGVLLAAMFGIVFNIAFLTEVAMSFFGMGVPYPLASIGATAVQNMTLLTFGDFIPIYILVLIVVFTTSVSLLVDWLQRRSGRPLVPSFRSYGPAWDIQR